MVGKENSGVQYGVMSINPEQKAIVRKLIFNKGQFLAGSGSNIFSEICQIFIAFNCSLCESQYISG